MIHPPRLTRSAATLVPFLCAIFLVRTLIAADAPATFRDAFSADDIDWQNTGETPENPAERNHPNLSHHDGILRAIGLIAPDGDGLFAHWGSGWTPGGAGGSCRVAFKHPVALGTILNGADWPSNVEVAPLSFLKPDAPYPGNLEDETQWEMLQSIRPCTGVTMFILPPGTATRAVRAKGRVSSMRMLAERFANLTPEAAIVASSGRPEDLQADKTWFGTGEKIGIDPQHPQYLILSWSTPRSIRGLMLSRPLFETYDVSTFTGPADADPLAAAETKWNVVRSVKLEKPWRAPNQSYVAFDANVETTAIRIRIQKGFEAVESGGGPNDVRLRGIAVLSPLGDALLASSKAAADSHPPIPLRFHLDQPGNVTLVIDDAAGTKRIKNLIADTPFPAGDNVAWWDGLDESLQLNPAIHGTYTLGGRLVAPGAYRVRGLVHKAVELHYEMSVYNAGDPSWFTPDGSGGWLADESPPTGAIFLPGKEARVLLSSPVAEAGHGLVWVDLTGKKRFGVRGIGAGGGWCGGTNVTRDAGTKPIAGIDAYAEVAFNGVFEVWALGLNKNVFTRPYPEGKIMEAGGLAVRNGVIATSLTSIGQLQFIDGASGVDLGTIALDNPRGLAFDAKGQLLALSGKQLVRLDLSRANNKIGSSGKPAVVISEGLEDPQQLTLDADGNIYVSDQGKSHQVKVFSSEGKSLRTIGAPGGPVVGPYDEKRMFNPTGITISDDGHLWVAESSYAPRRISVWTLNGQFVKALYGPGNYGGGGAIDPADKSLMFINANDAGTLQYRLDWKTGESRLESVCMLHTPASDDIPYTPQLPLDVNGRRYLTNLFAENPTNGEGLAFIWIFRDGVAKPIAAVGNSGGWAVLRDEKFRARWPRGVDLSAQPKPQDNKNAMFGWADLNGDGLPQPEEVTFAAGGFGALTIDHDMALTAITGERIAPQGFSTSGAPIYDPTKITKLIDGMSATTSGGAHAVSSGRSGWSAYCWPPKGLPRGYVTGVKDGQVRWLYPCETIGLHASAAAPLPKWPGYMIGLTRMLGPMFTPKGTDEEMWAVNANYGQVYLMTMDGLFVATLFEDHRQSAAWPVKAEHNMLLKGVSLEQEDFFPTINQTSDGNVYVVGRKAQAVVVRVDGLETTRRLPDATLDLTPQLLTDASDYFIKREARRLADKPPEVLGVSIRSAGPTIDGKLDDWQNVQWARLDDQTTAAMIVSGDQLYAAFRTGNSSLLGNTGQSGLTTLFKTGGGLDLMLGADPKADPNRVAPAAGDERFLVAMVNAKPVAMLYRPVVPGTKNPVPFVSPVRSISMDEVKDVSSSLQIAVSANGDFELSIPLDALHLHPEPGQIIRGDAGILRGDGVQAIQRLYWHNKMTGVVSDIPSEAELTPQLWGQLRFLRE